MQGKALFITVDGKSVVKVFKGSCKDDVIAKARAYAFNAFRQYQLVKVEF